MKQNKCGKMKEQMIFPRIGYFATHGSSNRKKAELGGLCVKYDTQKQLISLTWNCYISAIR